MLNDNSTYLSVDGKLVEYDELFDCLERMCRLQGHYAQLLNQYDAGERLSLPTPEDAIRRMRLMKDKAKAK